jgi:hypothetical protein
MLLRARKQRERGERSASIGERGRAGWPYWAAMASLALFAVASLMDNSPEEPERSSKAPVHNDTRPAPERALETRARSPRRQPFGNTRSRVEGHPAAGVRETYLITASLR